MIRRPDARHSPQTGCRWEAVADRIKLAVERKEHGSYDGNGGMSNRGYSRGNNVTDGLRELMYAAPAEMQGEINRLIKKLDNM